MQVPCGEGGQGAHQASSVKQVSGPSPQLALHHTPWARRAGEQREAAQQSEAQSDGACLVKVAQARQQRADGSLGVARVQLPHLLVAAARGTAKGAWQGGRSAHLAASSLARRAGHRWAAGPGCSTLSCTYAALSSAAPAPSPHLMCASDWNSCARLRPM